MILKKKEQLKLKAEYFCTNFTNKKYLNHQRGNTIDVHSVNDKFISSTDLPSHPMDFFNTHFFSHFYTLKPFSACVLHLRLKRFLQKLIVIGDFVH